MVGTPVYQVGSASSIQWKNFSALKPGVQKTEPPRDKGASSPAMRPWMWKSGVMFKPRSLCENSSVRAMFCAEIATLRCESGTILGREVVPEVCRISAMSSGCANPGCAACAGAPIRARCEKVGTGFSREARSKFLESITLSVFERFRSNAA